MDWLPIFISLKLALATTLALLLIALPLAYWLAYSKSFFKPFIEALVSMPLVLPPTVLGFYFLLAFSPNNAFGGWLDSILGLRLVFSFTGLVIASIFYSLPFMVHPLQTGFSSLPSYLREDALLMGKPGRSTFFKILLPNIKMSLITAIVLTFAHTIGEFGVVLMIGGNISGKTRVASVAIYEEVEALNYANANQYALILIGITFSILLAVYLFNGRYVTRFWK